MSEVTQTSWKRVEDEAPSWCEMPTTATGLELKPGLPGRSGVSPKTNAMGPLAPATGPCAPTGPEAPAPVNGNSVFSHIGGNSGVAR